jgi:hypothetical protein
MTVHPLTHLALRESLNWRPSRVQWFALVVYSLGFGLGFWAAFRWVKP